VQILDARGRVIRTISGTHKVNGKDVPSVPNDRSLNRLEWDFREDGPVRWLGAPKEESRGPKEGAELPPGTYTVRVTLSGRALTQTVDVRPDPRLSFTQADYQAQYDFEHKYFSEYSSVDKALNALDAVKKDLSKTLPPLRRGNSSAFAQGAAILRLRDQLFSRLTADFHNDEDGIARPGALREDVEGLTGVSGTPLPALLAFAATVDERYNNTMREYGDLATMVGSFNSTLRAAGRKPLRVPPKIAPLPSPVAFEPRLHVLGRVTVTAR
jgi:hypothetical protein